MTDAYPLQWPNGQPRTRADERLSGGFQVTPDKAQRDLRTEVARSGGLNLVVSTNIPVRLDGGFMLKAREPDDPGVAVYFTRKGKSICIACDNYDRVWKNARAIGLSIRDMRGPESRGCAAITDQAFAGFAVLPAPTDQRSWRDVLGLYGNPSASEVNAKYKTLAREHAGDEVRMKEINIARDAAMKEVK